MGGTNAIIRAAYRLTFSYVILTNTSSFLFSRIPTLFLPKRNSLNYYFLKLDSNLCTNSMHLESGSCLFWVTQRGFANIKCSCIFEMCHCILPVIGFKDFIKLVSLGQMTSLWALYCKPLSSWAGPLFQCYFGCVRAAGLGLVSLLRPAFVAV